MRPRRVVTFARPPRGRTQTEKVTPPKPVRKLCGPVWRVLAAPPFESPLTLAFELCAEGKRKGPPKLERPSLIFPLPFESQLRSNMVLHPVAHYVGVEPR